MSIPERFYRIARNKFHELRERIEEMDTDALAREEQRFQNSTSRSNSRQDALKELNSVNGEASPQPNRFPVATPDLHGVRPSQQLRTPEEIRRGAPTANSPQQEYDPLTPHYRLLGLEPGADFSTVQTTYHTLLTRCDPSRFPVGTTEAFEAEKIRLRLQQTFQVLKDALDPVSRRFDILEIDTPTPPANS